MYTQFIVVVVAAVVSKRIIHIFLPINQPQNVFSILFLRIFYLKNKPEKKESDAINFGFMNQTQ